MGMDFDGDGVGCHRTEPRHPRYPGEEHSTVTLTVTSQNGCEASASTPSPSIRGGSHHRLVSPVCVGVPYTHTASATNAVNLI